MAGAPDDVDAAPASDEADLARRLSAFPRLEGWLGFHQRFELTRFAVLRLLGFVYTAAYLSLALQVVPLVGREGLMPARAHVARTIATFGSRSAAFFRDPSLFYFVEPNDGALLSLSLVGLALSIALLAGASNALLMVALVVLYRSFIAMGQLFYGYGWELLLIETGFLAIFLCPWRGFSPFPTRRVPLAVIWLFRWLALRVMLGAGLIKLRGDSCWRDLTCLDFHFETQPIPNPLSPYYHALPHSLLAGGVLFNHLCELVLPLCILGPRKLRVVAAVGMILFQLILITSGNLSFLNWLTIVPLLGSFDDRTLSAVLPRSLHHRGGAEPATRAQVISAGVLSAVIGLLSIGPVSNMLARRQRMNAAFDSLMLVNSYGAFGSVGRVRPELIIEGTRDDDPGPDSRWLAYEFPFKPGDLERPHRIVSPCQPRLDWQIWFAAMAQAEDEPWMLHLVWKLLHADPGVRKLLARDPFGDTPPKYVRVMRYRYRFAPLGSEAYWTRELEGYWLPPLPADDILRDAMIQLGYIER